MALWNSANAKLDFTNAIRLENKQATEELTKVREWVSSEIET
jgi:hypothetical protein